MAISGNARRDKTSETSSQKLVKNYVIYDGLASHIYKIKAINVCLTILTLGIYSFWGKVRIRKYLARSFALRGDRFEYSGKGGELFKGFLKAAPILIFLIYPFIAGASYDTNDEELPLYLALWTFLSIIMFMTLLPMVKYMAMRYRLSRTRWRAIRGMLTGKVSGFLWVSLKASLLTMVTLGIYKPFADIKRFEYVANHLHVGNLQASFDYAAHHGLLKTYILTIVSMVLMFLVGSALLGTPTVLEAIGIGGVPNLLVTLCYIIGILFLSVGISVCLQFYKAKLIQAYMRGLKLGSLRFKSYVTGGKLAKFTIANGLILIFTLGMGRPIVLNRKMRFWSQGIVIGGDIESECNKIQQAQSENKDGLGEGVGEMMDLDMGL